MGGSFDWIVGVEPGHRLVHRDGLNGQWPAGSGLMFACALGLSGWFFIVRMIAWVAHALS